MLSDRVRKAITDARHEAVAQLSTRSSPSDLNALNTLDGLLFNDGVNYNKSQPASEIAVNFIDCAAGEGVPEGELAIDTSDRDPLQEIERLTRQREQDTKLIEGLRREIDKLKRGGA